MCVFPNLNQVIIAGRILKSMFFHIFLYSLIKTSWRRYESSLSFLVLIFCTSIIFLCFHYSHCSFSFCSSFLFSVLIQMLLAQCPLHVWATSPPENKSESPIGISIKHLNNNVQQLLYFCLFIQSCITAGRSVLTWFIFTSLGWRLAAFHRHVETL